jgi:hypothetical protein
LTKSVQIHDGNAIRYKLNPTEIAKWMNFFYKQYQAGEKENFDKYDEVIKKYNWDSIAIEWSVIIAKLLK